MGEENWRVNVVGTPALDTILNAHLHARNELEAMIGVDFDEYVILVIQHSVSSESDEAEIQITETMEAIRSLGYQTIVIYPNSDAGSRQLINVIESYRNVPFITIYKTLDQISYLSLMKYCSVMVGNSSSGIVEAPSFGLPAVNIGTRQDGRERGGNIIDVTHNQHAIEQAITKALSDRQFIEKMKSSSNPYGGGHSGHQIAEILSNIAFDKKLLTKRITY